MTKHDFYAADIMKSKSNPDFLKNDRSSINRQLRNIRSKVGRDKERHIEVDSSVSGGF